MGNFENLRVWKRAVQLSIEIYKVTKNGGLAKDFGLKDQLQRSAVSIPSNIAEGDELQSQKQAIRHFYIAKGSCAELLTQLIIAEAVGYISSEIFEQLQKECRIVSSQLQKLIIARRE